MRTAVVAETREHGPMGGPGPVSLEVFGGGSGGSMHTRCGRRVGRSLMLGVVSLLVMGLSSACDRTPVLLRGSVRFVGGGGAAGAEVALFTGDAVDPIARVTTDLDGAYRVRSSMLAAGTYRLRVGTTWYGGADRASAAPVTVSDAGVQVVDVDVPIAATISGVVVRDGFRFPGATVIVVAGSVVAGVTTTDASGSWSLPLASADPVRVLLSASSLSSPPVWVGGDVPAEFGTSSGTVTVPSVDLTTGARYEPGRAERVQVSAVGGRADGNAGVVSASADGRWIAFDSYATNLVPGDDNGVQDVFVRDLLTGTTTLASVATDGTQGNQASRAPSISADGRFVAFDSYATDLVEGDGNGRSDVFVRDLRNGTTTRVSVASDGPEGDDLSIEAAISPDGTAVAFTSRATNLVPGDTNGVADVFVHEVGSGVTERVSVASDGSQGSAGGSQPSISRDGRYVAFQSTSANLVPDSGHYWSHVHVRDRLTGTTSTDSSSPDGALGNAGSYRPVITPDGRFVAFWSDATNLVPGDANGVPDVFVRDRSTGTVEVVSVASDGTPQDAGYLYIASQLGISADGNRVVFDTTASNLTDAPTAGGPDVYVHDRSTVSTSLVSAHTSDPVVEGMSTGAVISGDGRHVAFTSSAQDLLPGDPGEVWDAYLRDLPGG